VSAAAFPEQLLPVLTRYRERYHWGWSITTRLINRYCGTNYTEKQLKKLYRQQAKQQNE
jgi:hypothetical protein